MVPNGWKKTTYSEGIKLLSGQHIQTSLVNDQGEGTPYLTGPADFPDGKIEVTKYTTSPKACCMAGDILLTVKGSGTGKSIVADDSYCISRQLMAIRPQAFDPNFTYHSIDSLTHSFEKAAAGLIPGIARPDVLDSKILVPPLPEQQKIARILSTWDKAIEKVDKLIENSQQQKKALMQQLLTGKKRLPGFSGEWKMVQVQEIAKVIRGASPRPKGDPRFYKGPIPRLMVEDVSRDGKYVTPRVDSLTKLGAEKSRPVSAGTLTIVCSGVVGVPSILSIDACIHDGFLALVDINETLAHTEFLYEIFSSMQQRFDQSATHGGIFTNLTTQILKEFTFSLPPLHEQERIARILSTWDKGINNLKQTKQQYQIQKQSLMQQLLTGKRRVEV